MGFDTTVTNRDGRDHQGPCGFEHSFLEKCRAAALGEGAETIPTPTTKPSEVSRLQAVLSGLNPRLHSNSLCNDETIKLIGCIRRHPGDYSRQEVDDLLNGKVSSSPSSTAS